MPLNPALINPILKSWAPRAVPTPLPPYEGAIEHELYEGSYESMPFRAEVSSHDGALAIRFGPSFKVYENSRAASEAPALRLRPLGDHLFAIQGEGNAIFQQVKFFPGPDRRMKWCTPLPYHIFARVHHR